MVWRAPSFGGVLPLKYYPQFCHSTTEDTTVGSETGYSSANNAAMLNPCSHDKSTVCLASGTSVNSPRGRGSKRPLHSKLCHLIYGVLPPGSRGWRKAQANCR